MSTLASEHGSLETWRAVVGLAERDLERAEQATSGARQDAADFIHATALRAYRDAKAHQPSPEGHCASCVAPYPCPPIEQLHAGLS